jgi:hypothetical protein
MLLFTLETLIVIGGFLLVRPLPRPVPWLVAILIAFSLVYCVTHVQVRFRAPLEPVFAVLIGGLLAGRSATQKAGGASPPKPNSPMIH